MSDYMKSSSQGSDTVSTSMLEAGNADWLSGKWQELVSVGASLDTSQPDPGLSLLYLQVAFSSLQLNKAESAIKFFDAARQSGATIHQIANTLVASTSNTLGRLYLLAGNREKALCCFEESLRIFLGRDVEFELINARAVQEATANGLLPQAAEFSEELLESIQKDYRHQSILAKINILKSELELINHNISLSHQKNQLYLTNGPLDIEQLHDIDSLKAISPSQLGQDLWVLQRTDFKKGGFFVEFGATDGVMLSNTFLLEQTFGWKGICSEPNPAFFDKLVKNRSCQCFSDCIAGQTGNQVTFICAEEYGGISDYMESDAHAEKRKSYSQDGKTISLTTISLHDFLKQANAPKNIDYISIDTEGSELEIISNFPFEEWNVSMFSIEHNFTESREDILAIMQDNGYERITAEWDDWYFKP